MFAADVHLLLAYISAAVLVAATAEGAIRVGRGSPAGAAAERARAATVLTVAITAAAGLALLVTGHRPTEWLHLLYATIAFGLVPVADNAAGMLTTDRGKALARLGGGVAALVVIARLFATG